MRFQYEACENENRAEAIEAVRLAVRGRNIFDLDRSIKSAEATVDRATAGLVRAKQDLRSLIEEFLAR